MSSGLSGDLQFATPSEYTKTPLESWGPTLVVAPHQDDETLGCGGTIALLRKRQLPVEVVFVSDGSMSHPNSIRFSAETRMHIREQEAIEALSLLGVKKVSIHFMRLKDTQVPMAGEQAFEGAVEAMLGYLRQFQPQCILAPWQRDPHCDHRASWQITMTALQRYGMSVRVLAYPIWIWELAAAEDWPRKDEVMVHSYLIEETLPLKKKAIAAHRSQTTRLIDDDPEGFILTDAILNHFFRPYELFLENL